MPKVHDDNLARQYLLGELSEQDQAKLEEQYFEDDEVFGRLSAVEDDLIDAYTLDQLSTSDRERFEERLLLSSAQRERLKFARTLLRTASGAQEIESNIPPSIPTAWWRISPFTFLRRLNPIVSVSAAAILILAVITGWWLIHRSNVRRSQEEQSHQQTNPQSPEQESQAINQNTHQASQPKQQEPKTETPPRMQSNRIITFALVQGVVRDLGESNHLVIPSAVSMVRLNLTIERGEYRTYLADLRRTEGEKVWERGGVYPDSVTSGKGTIVLLVPAGVLKNGDYILTLNGTASGRTEVVGEYSFRVVRN